MRQLDRCSQLTDWDAQETNTAVVHYSPTIVSEIKNLMHDQAPTLQWVAQS